LLYGAYLFHLGSHKTVWLRTLYWLKEITQNRVLQRFEASQAWWLGCVS